VLRVSVGCKTKSLQVSKRSSNKGIRIQLLYDQQKSEPMFDMIKDNNGGIVYMLLRRDSQKLFASNKPQVASRTDHQIFLTICSSISAHPDPEKWLIKA
jgi:hypothetical protein